MYIGANRQVVDPNIVSGADFDNRHFNNYEGRMFDNYDGVSEEIDSELMAIHEKIKEGNAKVTIAEARLPLATKELEFALTSLGEIGDKLLYLVQESQNPNITTSRKIELDAKISGFQEQKATQRLKWSKLRAEISKLNTTIGANSSMSAGLSQEFKAKAGFDYEPPTEAVEVPNIIGDFAVESLKPEATEVKNSLITKISDKIGTSENNTKYLLIGAGALAIIYLTKK